MRQLGHKNTDLDRYVYLMNLLDHDETLFYRTIMSDPARFLPIVYDPTIGEALVAAGYDRPFPELRSPRADAPVPAGRWREIALSGLVVRRPVGLRLDLNGVAKGRTVAHRKLQAQVSQILPGTRR